MGIKVCPERNWHGEPPSFATLNQTCLKPTRPNRVTPSGTWYYLAFPLLYRLHGDQRVGSDAWRAVGAGVRDDRSGPTPRSQWADHLPEEWRRERRSTSRHQNEPRGGARGGGCLTRPSCASSLAHDYPDRRHDHQDRRRDGPVSTNCLAWSDHLSRSD